MGSVPYISHTAALLHNYYQGRDSQRNRNWSPLAGNAHFVPFWCRNFDHQLVKVQEKTGVNLPNLNLILAKILQKAIDILKKIMLS